MNEIDTASGRKSRQPKDNPPSVKRMCRASHVASILLLLHGLRCSGATSPRDEAHSLGSAFAYRIPHGATILPLLSICENLLSKKNPKNSGHDKVVDQIMCVWCCGPKKPPIFRFSKNVPQG